MNERGACAHRLLGHHARGAPIHLHCELHLRLGRIDLGVSRRVNDQVGMRTPNRPSNRFLIDKIECRAVGRNDIAQRRQRAPQFGADLAGRAYEQNFDAISLLTFVSIQGLCIGCFEKAREALLDGEVAREADTSARKRRYPFFVQAQAAHALVGGVVLRGPIDEFQMLHVHLATLNNRVAIALSLALHDTRHSQVMRDLHEDRQLETWNEDVTPPAQGARKHPARMRIESLHEHPLTDGDFADLLKRRVGRFPEVAIHIEVRMSEPFGYRGRERRGTGARCAKDVDSIREGHCASEIVSDVLRGGLGERV